jgi:hypothetical protein
MKVVIEKSVVKEKRYDKISSTTQYVALGKTYYAHQTSLAKIKKFLKGQGYTEFVILDRGVSKMNY